jgi:hypothetical protein
MISRIGWNEMRTRATQFSKDWAGAFFYLGIFSK